MLDHPLALYLMVGAGTFLLTVAMVPLCRKLAIALDVVDRPSSAR
ncbi:MAG: hypothetical protein RLZZ303_2063, partial [Candidatus Hydrogenedentota bacterium]